MLFKILDKQDKKKFILLVCLTLISGLLALIGLGSILPFITALLSPSKNWLSTLFPGQKQEHILLLSVFAMIAGFWIKNILSYYCLRTQTKILYGISYKFSRKLFQAYMTASYIWYLSRSTPELVRNVVNECSVLANGVLGALGSLATELMTSVFIFIVLLYINVEFTLIVGGCLMLFMLLFMRITRHKAAKYAIDRAQAWSAMTKDVMQGVGGIKEVKIYELEHHFISSFNAHTHTAARSAAFSNVYSQSPRFILEAAAITVVMFAIGILLLFDHSSNQKIILLLSVFAVAAMQLLPSLNRMMTALATIKYSLPALDTVSKEFNRCQGSPHAEVYSKQIAKKMTFQKELSLQGVSFAYPDGKVALDNISLSIQKGQAVAFVGHSGAGKTTLADILLGLVKLKSGTILVDGVELTEGNLSQWHKNLGYIPQSIYLYDCTIGENVAFGEPLENLDKQKIWQALDMASMKEFVENLPQGLDTQIGENGVRLSGGQRQRIGIARALFRNPDVLIMDEATAALDNQTEREVTQAIQKASKNRTVITIAHRLSTIKNSDMIYVMEHGKIIANGSYSDLIGSCALFKNLVKIEAHKGD